MLFLISTLQRSENTTRKFAPSLIKWNTGEVAILLGDKGYDNQQVRALARKPAGHGGDTITTALRVLEAADLIHTERDGNKRLISANRDRLQNPADPIAHIPQNAFRQPVQAFLGIG